MVSTEPAAGHSNVSSFFSDPKDIKLCVHESMSDHIANPDLKGWIASDEVQDVKSLNEEIKKLREENAALTEKLEQSKIQGEVRLKSTSNDSLNELIEVLKATEIKVPSNITGGEKEQVSDLLHVMVNNKDTLINGVTNSSDVSDVAAFYYFNIFPKLQMHGLADNEKIAGVRYRRSFLNKSGQALLAYLEKKRILEKKDSIKVESKHQT